MLGLGFGGEVGAAIAGGQIPAVGEGFAAADHRQVDRTPIPEYLRHGAAVAVPGLDAEIHSGTQWDELLQLLTRGRSVGALGGFRRIDAGPRIPGSNGNGGCATCRSKRI